jgi:hypothetical protein
LVEGSLITHAPTQVDDLEAAAMRHRQVTQTGEDFLLQCIALGLQVAEGGTDEDPKGTGRLSHIGISLDPFFMLIFYDKRRWRLRPQTKLASLSGGTTGIPNDQIWKKMVEV